jgi:hypothetical protein
LALILVLISALFSLQLTRVFGFAFGFGLRLRLRLCRRSSAAWSRTLLFSALFYWLMSFYEDTRKAEDTAPLQFLADLLFVSVFAVDLYMRYQVRGVPVVSARSKVLLMVPFACRSTE